MSLFGRHPPVVCGLGGRATLLLEGGCPPHGAGSIGVGAVRQSSCPSGRSQFARASCSARNPRNFASRSSRGLFGCSKNFLGRACATRATEDRKRTVRCRAKRDGGSRWRLPEQNARAAIVHSVSSTKIRAPTSVAPGDGARLCGGVWLSVPTASLPAGMDMADDSLLALGRRAAQSISRAGTAGPIPKVDPALASVDRGMVVVRCAGWGAVRLGGSGAAPSACSGTRSASDAQCKLDLSMPGSPVYQHFLLSISRQAQ